MPLLKCFCVSRCEIIIICETIRIGVCVADNIQNIKKISIAAWLYQKSKSRKPVMNRAAHLKIYTSPHAITHQVINPLKCLQNNERRESTRVCFSGKESFVSACRLKKGKTVWRRCHSVFMMWHSVSVGLFVWSWHRLAACPQCLSACSLLWLWPLRERIKQG